MKSLSMAFLGEPQVEYRGKRLGFRTRKALALLVYLSVDGSRHSREKLATLFWPEEDGETGRRRLRTTLYYLRQALREVIGDDAAADYLATDRESLAFNFRAPYELDVETLLQAADEDSLDLLQSAAAAYRGDFLAGFAVGGAREFDDWAAERRQELALVVTSVLRRLVDRLERRGSRNGALQSAQRWVHLDSFNEQAYRRLMELLAAMGDRAAALERYQEIEDRLGAEFGAEPAAETQALAKQIHAGGILSAGAEAEPRRRPTADRLPFVGRGVEHESLVKEFELARHDGPRLVLLQGEAGIGKSRLAQEWMRWARAHGAHVLQGRAFDFGGRLPYQPLLDAVREVVTDGDRIETLLGPGHLKELGRMFPELGLSEYHPTADWEEKGSSGRMFDAFVNLLNSLSQEQPLVIYLDDMQWADRGTRDLLTFAASRWQQSRPQILMVLLQRDTEVDAAAEHEGWVTRLSQALPTKTLRLGPLARNQTITWVHELAGTPRQASRQRGDEAVSSAPQPPGRNADTDAWTALGRRLYEVTSGQPFFLTETTKGLLDRGVLSWRRAKDDSWRIGLGPQAPAIDELGSLQNLVAPSVRQAVRARLTSLTEPMFELLVAAAVLSRQANFASLCFVADMAESEALLPLDQLIEARLLEEARSDADQGLRQEYAFSHDQIRQITYQVAGSARRSLFHRRAFELLSERGGSPADMAHHGEAAGLWEQAWKNNLVAGLEALEVFAIRDAIRFLERARSLLVEQKELWEKLQPEKVQRLYERLGRAYEVVNDWDRAKHVYEELIEHAGRVARPEAEVSARLSLASLSVQQFDVDRAARILEDAIELAEACDDQHGLAEAEWHLATVEYFRFQREDALLHAERAVELARACADPELIAGSLNSLGYARQGLARWSEIEPPLLEAIELFRQQGNRAMEIDSELMLAVGRIHLADPGSALDIAARAEGKLIDADNPWGEANQAWVQATALHELGRYQEAINIASRGLEIALDNDLPALALSALATRGMAFGSVGRLNLALEDHQRAEDLLDQMANPHMPAVLAPHLCTDFGMAGEWDAAADHARRAIRDNEAWLHSATWLCSGFQHGRLIEALLRAGELDLARSQLERFERFGGKNPRYQIPAARSRALLLEAEGRLQGAIEELQSARDLSHEKGLPGEELSHCLALHRRYEQLDHAPEQKYVQRRAVELARELKERIGDPELRTSFLDWLDEQGLRIPGN